MRCAVAESLGDVDQLTQIESLVDSAVAVERLSTRAGEVVAFGVRMSSRQERYAAGNRKPTEHPLQQLADGLLAADGAGHEAAVALYRLGQREPLWRRARATYAPVRAGVERAWLDCWRLADLGDAPLERVCSVLNDGDDVVLNGAVVDDVWGWDERDRACRDAGMLRGLGVERPDLTALAASYSRLRFCRAVFGGEEGPRVLKLPLDERLAAFCDRLNGDSPAELDLQMFTRERAARAVTALAEAGDAEAFRLWNANYHDDAADWGNPSEPLMDSALKQVRGVLRVASDDDLMRGTMGEAVAGVLKVSAAARSLAWREADHPRAARNLVEWALAAGAPFPGWMRATIEKDAVAGRGWPEWLKHPAFQRERLVWVRAHGPEEGASLACISFDAVRKDASDELVAQYAVLVLEWVETARQPFVPERGHTFGRNLVCDLTMRSDGESVPDPPPQAAERRGPPWYELVRFLDAVVLDARCPRERVVAALERLWDLITAARPTHDMSLIEGEPPQLKVHQGSCGVFDDIARLLLAAGAPARIESLLRHGIPEQPGDKPSWFEGAISSAWSGTRTALRDPPRMPRTRSELLQMRVLVRFRPPGFDPGWMLGQGDLLEEWAWFELAVRGEPDAVDRLIVKLDEIDLAEPGWTEHEALLSMLIAHRREIVIEWLLREAAKSEAHADEAKGIVVGWAEAWGPRSAELAAWARGGPATEAQVPTARLG